MTYLRSPRRGQRSRVVAVSLPERDIKRLDELAKRYGQSQSGVLVTLIRRDYDERIKAAAAIEERDGAADTATIDWVRGIE